MSIPQRVVSLWDMMNLHAARFVSAVLALQSSNMIVKSVKWRHDTLFDPTNLILGESLDVVCDRLIEAGEEIQKLGVPVTFKAFQRISRSVADKQITYQELADCLEDMFKRLVDELDERKFYAVEPSYAAYLDSEPAGFGAAVDIAFPLASEDINEAGKCLALNRGTAAVFHLMRAMECAVQAMATALSIPEPERVWGILLSDIQKAAEAMPKGEERNRWSASVSHLYHVKQAWRNDTMHPKKTYTPEEAQKLFAAVRSYMQDLAPLVVPGLELA